MISKKWKKVGSRLYFGKEEKSRARRALKLTFVYFSSNYTAHCRAKITAKNVIKSVSQITSPNLSNF